MSPMTARNPQDKTTVSEVAGDIAPMLTEIDHVAIAVRDLGAAIDYYRETFGALVEHREIVESDGVEGQYVNWIRQHLTGARFH